jgi:hypothetical protein
MIKTETENLFYFSTIASRANPNMTSRQLTELQEQCDHELEEWKSVTGDGHKDFMTACYKEYMEAWLKIEVLKGEG